MNIGIIGLGIVGGACKYGFEKLGHTIKVHDIKLNTKIEDVLDTKVCYICVPTPSKPDGECDVSIVRDVVHTLIDQHNYRGVIAIKSTVKPTTTQSIIEDIDKVHHVCFVPEFLRERCAVSDFTENHDLLVIGTEDKSVFNKIKRCHGHYPKKIKQLKPTEAELLKYYSNVFNALRVTFANEMYEICKKLGIDYTSIKDTFILRGTTTDMYLDVNDNFRGYAGVCLPKDTVALAHFVKELGLDLKLFETIEAENKKFKKTVPEGMRI